MKKLCCITLSLLLGLGLISCQATNTENPDTSVTDVVSETITNPPPTETLPPLSPDEMETFLISDCETGYYNSIYGKITKKISSNVLVLAPDTPRYIEQWGELVYVITDEAGEWCIGDEIEVHFRYAECPLDKTQYIRITADRVDPLALDFKPIIYFYPEAPTLCSAKVTLNGQLTCTYPDHGTNGWQNFTANPDGTLTFPDGKSYYALYWEGIQSAEWDFSQGFCVKGEDTAEFLEWALASQGLTEREANEFIIYWLPLMQDNPYNVISFQADTYTDGAKLEITPSPDTLIRVFMAYYPSDIAVNIAPQAFDTPVRQGFTVVEWGGSPVEKP